MDTKTVRKPGRRLDDRRPAGPLQWGDEPADQDVLASVCGKVIEVGNLDGDIGICVELPDRAGVLTVIGLTQEQARSIAPLYAGDVEIIVRAVRSPT